MKRKIAAIFAADIAGYSRLVAEDEEETLRRLASYRLVTDDFIAKSGGRIFNTAGDAVLAEFPSAVEAVRCAIDIQESLRTRNMAYPSSRQMSFRIGITIGDVVERDGDLLGDGVNIAARLEGLAEVGGICISRAVHEQVANKLSVQFADIGAQEVKNIPTPVHAYMVAMRREDGTYATPQIKKKPEAATTPNWMWPVAVTLVCLAAIGVGGFLYFTKIELPVGSKAPSTASNTSPPPVPAPAPTSASERAAAPPPPSPPPIPSNERFAADKVPFVSDRTRMSLVNDYSTATDHKALALTNSGINVFVTAQPSEEAARSAVLEQCQKRVENLQPPRKCELYAVDNIVVFPHGGPPMPPQPWVRHDPSIEKPFATKDMPLVREAGKTRIDSNFPAGRRGKAMAIGPGGQYYYLSAQESAGEAVRRTLEGCGAVSGVPCMVVSLDDVFVVPIPTTLKAVGFFRADGNSMIAPDARVDVAQRLADASTGWNAVAVGSAGRPGLALKSANEQDAVNEALGNCVKRDSDCHVIAIGPFAVGPN
jgi:class 3 adenylate cyclase